METATRVVERQASSVSMPTPVPDVARALSATATFQLSEQGRKASLLAGGDGHAIQQITLQVPASRLHLVSVDRNGVARLKLRPRFEMDAERGVVRIDSAPLYDAPPTIEELYRAAARNHELESVYLSERTVERAKRRDSDRERRESVARSFLSDKTQRAVVHPSPSPKSCHVDTERGRLVFDVATDQGVAKEVPPEAHRRFRADLRARDERNKQDRASQLALHDEKKRFIADWVSANGTDEQRGRHNAGVLPINEAIEAITNQVFDVVGDLPQYVRDGADRLQRALRESTGSLDVTIAPADVQVRSANAPKATSTQWALVQKLQSQLPDANVVLREHVLSSKNHHGAISVFGVLVTKKLGPLALRREFLADML